MFATEMFERGWDGNYTFRCASGHTWIKSQLDMMNTLPRDRRPSDFPCPFCSAELRAATVEDPDQLRVEGLAE